MSEVVLFRPNTDRLKHFNDYVRGCSTGYLDQTLTALNMLMIMSEFILLLPTTDHPQHVEYYIRGCSV